MSYELKEHSSEDISLIRKSSKSAMISTIAAILTDGGMDLSMAELAEKARVGRATLYRYFPNRQHLLESIRDYALKELSEVISETLTENIDVKESLARISRAILAQSEIGLLLMRERVLIDRKTLENTLLIPLDNIVEIAKSLGLLDETIPSRTLSYYFAGLLRTSTILTVQGNTTAEQATHYILQIFFDGFRPHQLG